MTKSPEQHQKIDQHPRSRILVLIKSLWRRTENVVFGLILLIVSLYFLLQMPAVQNWMVAKVTNYLSNEWQTTVSLQRVDIEFFDNLVLEGLYVEDVAGDTLFYVGKVSAGMKTNFFAFLTGKVEFNDIGISKARINIRRFEGNKRNSLKEFLSKISKSSGKNKQTGAVRISIQNLHLDDVVILKDIETNNKRNPLLIDRERQLFRIPYGLIRINLIDPDNNLVDIRSVHLAGLTVDLEESERVAILPIPEALPAASPTVSLPSVPMIFKIGDLLVTSGHFEMDMFDESPARSTLTNVMDYEHLKVQNIVLQGENHVV